MKGIQKVVLHGTKPAGEWAVPGTGDAGLG